MKLAQFRNAILKVKAHYSCLHSNHNHLYGLRNVLGFSFHSKISTPYSDRSSHGILYRRLSPLGDPNVSIVPVLDQWVQEGKPVEKDTLEAIIKQLRHYGRFKHALELSTWMSDVRYMKLTTRDIAIRLDLISAAHGIEQAKQYFETIPTKMRKYEVYSALLNCYARVASVEEAEATMQTMRDNALARTSLSYNTLLTLYNRTGNHEKAANLIKEMEGKGIEGDSYTVAIRLNACAANVDVDGIEKIMTEIGPDSSALLDWTNYSVAANGYIKAGHTDKAFEMLKKAEKLIATASKGKKRFVFLITQYATIGKKDAVSRLWEVFKKHGKIYNRGYMAIIASILKFDDLEWAEKVFDEWESKELSFDIRIPNLLLSYYGRKGLVDKAENLLNKIISEGNKPDSYSWSHLASGFVQVQQTSEAVAALKKALGLDKASWKPRKEVLAACLEYLKEKGELEEAENFVKSLKVEEMISPDAYDTLLSYVKGLESNLDIWSWYTGEEQRLGLLSGSSLDL